MDPEQAQLVLQIISRLDRNAVTGEWPDEKCGHCNGVSSGYYDLQSFDHTDDCIVPLISDLRSSTYK